MTMYSKHSNSLSTWWKALLYYTWFIVVWGAFVRASGSGDGCGQNWPSCHGELIPKNSSIETLIEYIHRATSGLYGIFVLLLVCYTLIYVYKSRTSYKSQLYLYFWLPTLVLVLTILEALIGAKLVLSGLVGSNESWARAFIMIFHLLNTFLLIGCIVGCIALFSAKLSNKSANPKRFNIPVYLLITFSLVVVAGLGALTALGDTLYPAGSLSEGISQDLSTSSPWILRLRVLHPVLAMMTVLLITSSFYDHYKTHITFKTYLILAHLTLFLGIVNLILLAPIYMQIIHLFSAQALWSLHCYIGFKNLHRA